MTAENGPSEVEFVDRQEFDALAARVTEIEEAIKEASQETDDVAEDVGDAAESAVRRGLKKLFG